MTRRETGKSDRVEEFIFVITSCRNSPEHAASVSLPLENQGEPTTPSSPAEARKTPQI